MLRDAQGSSPVLSELPLVAFEVAGERDGHHHPSLLGVDE